MVYRDLHGWSCHELRSPVWPSPAAVASRAGVLSPSEHRSRRGRSSRGDRAGGWRRRRGDIALGCRGQVVEPGMSTRGQGSVLCLAWKFFNSRVHGGARERRLNQAVLCPCFMYQLQYHAAYPPPPPPPPHGSLRQGLISPASLPPLPALSLFCGAHVAYPVLES